MTKLTTFFELINAQFTYGGQKYAHNSEKESTDCLFDDFGKGWLYGTMAKYCKRIKNLKRERDILKIATYLFILWLKRGFHLTPEGQSDPINTTVDTKSGNFSNFRVIATESIHTCLSINESLTVDNLYTAFKNWTEQDWEKLTEGKILNAFGLCYYIWQIEFGDNAGADQDCWNEDKKTVRLEEGSIQKGGLGKKPESQRPEPPKAQSVSRVDSKKDKG